MAYRRRRPRFGTTGCLFWLFILLVIVVIFLFRGKGNLKEAFSFLKNLRKDKREELVRKPVSEAPSKEEARPSEEESEPVHPKGEVKPSETEGLAEDEEKPPAQETEVSKKQAPEGKKVPGGAGAWAPGTEQRKPQQETPQTKKSEIRAKTLSASLYFVKIDSDDGSVKPVPVDRTIEYKDSPITRTVDALLRGPTEAERKKGIISLIPEGTRLLSARIDNGHLVLNFSHHFEENYTGREAILLELSQVILTAFDFSQVAKVSILIEGKPKRYITGEGIPLKEAYTKQDLPSLKPEG